MTPLHYDPYVNLFTLADCSTPDAAKHFVMFPPLPEVTSVLQRAEDSHLRNTSLVDLELAGKLDSAEVDGVRLAPQSPAHSQLKILSQNSLSATLRKDEMLLVPLRWWHRVQNIGPAGSWTAGVGHWFRIKG